jgi:hypothetical protein
MIWRKFFRVQYAQSDSGKTAIDGIGGGGVSESKG